jgi:hypothetical protein
MHYNKFLKLIKTEHVIHRGENRIKLVFPFDNDTIAKVKKIPGRKWSQTMGCWHVPHENDTIKILTRTLPGITIVNLDTPKSTDDKTDTDGHVKLKVLKDYQRAMELKRLKPKTIEVYLHFFEEYVEATHEGDIITAQYKDLYLYIKKRALNLGHTRKKQMIAAIKFYYERVLGYEKLFFNLGKERVITKQSLFIDFAEIKKITSKINSPHDRLLLFLAYHVRLSPKQIAGLPYEPEGSQLLRGWMKENKLSARFLEELYSHHTKKLEL